MNVDTEEVMEILEHFGKLEDPRSHINRRHLLGDLMVICVSAVLSGCDGPIAIGHWAQAKAAWLKQHLPLPHGIPSHDTIGRVLVALQPQAFQACFAKWIAAIIKAQEPPPAEAPHGQSAAPAAVPAALPPRHIAIDGKTLRRSHDRRKGLGPLHLVSAWAVECGVSLGQLATEEKSNEITAIPELLAQVELPGSVVTIDAAGCQKEIAAKIVEGRGDYCLALKGNQGKLHAAVAEWIEARMADDFADCQVQTWECQEKKRHGRVDHYIYHQLPAPADLPGKELWKKLRTIGVAIRLSTSRGKETSEVRYYINSLPLDVRLFAKSVRGHWAIENTLHWCLDVTFREDDSRVRERNLTNNLAWLKRFAISLLKQVPDKLSVAMRRRSCGWNTDYLAQVLFGSAS
jgi:predicted transposase YbfD/YdcC